MVIHILCQDKKKPRLLEQTGQNRGEAHEVIMLGKLYSVSFDSSTTLLRTTTLLS